MEEIKRMREGENVQKLKTWAFVAFGVLLIYGGLLYIEALSFNGNMRVAHISMLAGALPLMCLFILTFKFQRIAHMPMYTCVFIQLLFIIVGSYLHELEFYFFITLLAVGCASITKDFKPLAICVAVMTVINILALVFFFPRLHWLPHYRFFMQFMMFLYGSAFLLLQTYNVQNRENKSMRAFMAFAALLRTTPNSMIITNSKRQIRYLSDAMAKFIQCRQKELAIGRPLIDLVSDNGLKKMFSDILSSDDYYEDVIQLNMENEERYFKVISDKLPREIGGLFIDISDITSMVKSQMEAEEANIAKSKFLAAISHEIRTPMNVILGITEIEMNKEETAKDVLDSFRKIYNSGYTLLGIINDILDFSKMEAGKFQIVPTKYDVASLINDTVQLNIMRLGSKRIEFMLNVSENLPAYLIGDELRIKQVLNNLLSNAIKYTDKGSVTLEFKAERDKENVRLIINVRDTGQGMSSEQTEKLFSEYSRFNLEANYAVEGTGLGLSITKKLVELMRGSIMVESKQGAGSVFNVQILQQVCGNRIIGKEVAENLQKFNLSGKSQMKKISITREYMPYGKVLVVDDIETNLFVAKGLLSPYGLKIETVTSGFEALDKIKKGTVYDVVFMDHMMPKMDGVETVKLLREFGYTHPVVALTANAIAGQAEIFIQSGFDAFISKPIDIMQMDAILNKMIRDKQSPEVIEIVRKQQKASARQKTLRNSELLAVFAEDGKNALLVLENIFKNIEAATDKDLHLFTINAHAMKSALTSIGENEASKLATLLEDAGNNRDKNAIRAEAQSFIEALTDIIAKIDAKFLSSHHGRK